MSLSQFVSGPSPNSMLNGWCTAVQGPDWTKPNAGRSRLVSQSAVGCLLRVSPTACPDSSDLV